MPSHSQEKTEKLFISGGRGFIPGNLVLYATEREVLRANSEADESHVRELEVAISDLDVSHVRAPSVRSHDVRIGARTPAPPRVKLIRDVTTVL